MKLVRTLVETGSFLKVLMFFFVFFWYKQITKTVKAVKLVGKAVEIRPRKSGTIR
jgi:hypothetical protein